MPALPAYRQFISREAGRYEAGTFDAAGGDTDSAVDAQLVSSISQDDLYSDYWLLIPAAAADDKVRVVKTYTPSSGTLDVDRVWSAATVWQSDPYELHGAIEPQVTMLDLINEALKECLVVCESTVTAVANQTRHSLAALTGLQDPRWVRQAGLLLATYARDEHDPYLERPLRGTVERDGSVIYLSHPQQTIQTTDTIYVRWIRPAYTYCKAAAGVYGSQSGLALETDECSVPVDWVAFRALMLATRRTRGITGDKERRDMLLSRQQEFAAMFSQKTAENFALPPLGLYPPMRSWGPRRGRARITPERSF